MGPSQNILRSKRMYCMYRTSYSTYFVNDRMQLTTKINPEIKERIVQAANELVIDGIPEPTNAQVLKKMGKGSLSHVSPVMRDWRAERKREALKQYEIPKELETVMQVSLSKIWTLSTDLSRAELNRFKQTAKEQLRECESERDEALSEVKTLEEQISMLESRLVENDEECKCLTKELTAVQDAFSKERTRNTLLEETVNTQQETINKLQDELIAIAKQRTA